MSLTIKRLYQCLPWLLSLVLAAVLLFFTASDLAQQERWWQAQLDTLVKQQQAYLIRSQKELLRLAVVQAEAIAENEEILAQLKLAARHYVEEDDAALAAVRLELKHLLLPYWQRLDAPLSAELSIYLSPNLIAFLRMQQPNSFGDSLLGISSLVTQSVQSGALLSGLDLGRQGSGYRALLPLNFNVADGEMFNVLIEVSLARLPNFDDELAVINSAMFLHKNSADKKLWEAARNNLYQRYGPSIDDWYLEFSASAQLETWWANGLVAVGQQGYLLQWEDRSYITSWFPVNIFNAAPDAAEMAQLLWQDVTEAHRSYLAARQRVISRWLVTFIFAELFILFFVRFNKHVLRSYIDQYNAQLQQEHHESEQARQRLALALRSSDAGFWEWDIVKDTVNFSPEWRTLCGIPAELSSEFDLDEWMGRVHPADKRKSYTDMIRHIKGETAMYENEYRIRVADESYRWILTRGKVVSWDNNGRASLMLGVYSDISERKNTELINVRQQAALQTIHEIASLRALDTRAQLRKALELGAGYLGLNGAFIAEVTGESCQVEVHYHNYGRNCEGEVRALAQSYVQEFILAAGPLADDESTAAKRHRNMLYSDEKIETFIGMPLQLAAETYGVLCLYGDRSRKLAYDKLDHNFVRLLTGWMSSVIERWRKEQDNKLIVQRFRKLSERLPGFLYQMQMNDAGACYFSYVSSGIENLFNVDADEVIKNKISLFSLIALEDIDWVQQSIAFSALNITPWIVTVRVDNAQRGQLWVHIESMPERLNDGTIIWHGYVSDITSLQKTELQLQEIHALRKAILDSEDIAIISSDKNGVIKLFNSGAESMLGYSANEIINIKMLDFFHLAPELNARRELLAKELNASLLKDIDVFTALPSRGETDETEWNWVSKGGHLVPVLLTVSALRDPYGEVTGYLALARDISALKRIDKMKSEFISTVSHELRTPLTSINGALGIITSGQLGDFSPQAKSMLTIAHKNSQRLICLVNDLLDMEKLVSGHMTFDCKPRYLQPIIQSAIEANSEYAKQFGVSYELLKIDENLTVNVDDQRLIQVLTNYLSNAAKFSPVNGCVRIVARCGFGRVRVMVIDQGPGVAAEEQHKLFKKFSQIDSSDARHKGGTGLGLAICKEIIERMKGEVGVISTRGKGSCFYFDLPDKLNDFSS
jgi:PAS domain S-box-containing protein